MTERRHFYDKYLLAARKTGYRRYGVTHRVISKIASIFYSNEDIPACPKCKSYMVPLYDKGEDWLVCTNPLCKYKTKLSVSGYSSLKVTSFGPLKEYRGYAGRIKLRKDIAEKGFKF